MVMYDMVSLFNDFEEMGNFGDNVLIERLLDLIQIVSFGDQNADRVYILLSLVDLLIVFVFAQQRLHNQKVVLLELDRKDAVAELFTRQDEVGVECELLLG